MWKFVVVVSIVSWPFDCMRTPGLSEDRTAASPIDSELLADGMEQKVKA